MLWFHFIGSVGLQETHNKRKLQNKTFLIRAWLEPTTVRFKVRLVTEYASRMLMAYYIWKWQYDPVIIERTIGLVLGPSTALYEPFLKHCTLTNKAVGTIWRALSKPPQRRQGPDLCPLWLLVGTPSAIRPELAFSRAEHSRPYLDVAKYIFYI